MKKIIFCFCFALAFSLNVEACPYSKMTELDSKLNSDDSQISSQTFAKISNLRSQGEEKLRIGELDNAEEIFDRALALLKNNNEYKVKSSTFLTLLTSFSYRKQSSQIFSFFLKKLLLSVCKVKAHHILYILSVQLLHS